MWLICNTGLLCAVQCESRMTDDIRFPSSVGNDTLMHIIYALECQNAQDAGEMYTIITD